MTAMFASPGIIARVADSEIVVLTSKLKGTTSNTGVAGDEADPWR